MTRYAAAHLVEIDLVDDGRTLSRPIRLHFGISSFGINAWQANEAGQQLIFEHDEIGVGNGQEELYFVQAGHARFQVDGETVDAPVGTCVFVAPGVTRSAVATVPATTIMVVGGSPGRVFQPEGFDLWAPVAHLHASGDYAAAAARGRELIAAHPGHAGLLYNVACCESLAGDLAGAIAHLGEAVDLAERFRVMAAGDSDFEPLRDDPAFERLTS